MITDKQTAERNARRRARYAEDPEFRAKCIRATRNNYRQRNGRVDRDTCLRNLGSLASFGTKRLVAINYGRAGLRVTFTTEQLAEAMNRRVEVVYRWVHKDMFPPPSHQVDTAHNQHDNVYTLEEARAIVRIMGEHQKETPYYRTDHAGVRDRLMEVVGT